MVVKVDEYKDGYRMQYQCPHSADGMMLTWSADNKEKSAHGEKVLGVICTY